jgi:hypothetical protein
MRRAGWAARVAALLVAAFAAAPSVALAQTSRARRADISTDEVIRRFAESESRLRDARNQFAFKQDVTIQTMMGTQAVTGTYRRVSEILFTDDGQRQERITFFPQSTLQAITVTTDDLRDLGVIQPFALTSEDLPKYDVRYVGREKLDEIDTYVFDVSPRDPKAMAKAHERYFQGRVWVEDQDYMIVKVAGKAGPETGDSRFPRFETYRENIDGKYWFPTYTYADDILSFKTGDVHIRMVVKYADYRQFTGNITIVEDGPMVDPDENPAEEPPPAAQPTRKP